MKWQTWLCVMKSYDSIFCLVFLHLVVVEMVFRFLITLKLSHHCLACDFGCHYCVAKAGIFMHDYLLVLMI